MPMPSISSFWLTGAQCGSCCLSPAWNEYQKRTGKTITDPLAIEIAGRYLKRALESGEGLGKEMYSLTVEQTLQNLDAVVKSQRR